MNRMNIPGMNMSPNLGWVFGGAKFLQCFMSESSVGNGKGKRMYLNLSTIDLRVSF